jgi:hypothetical protein
VNRKTAFPATGTLAPKKRAQEMNNNHGNPLRSGSAAIVLFTALSSISAIATALLPFVAHA